jgi:hypothetical protein
MNAEEEEEEVSRGEQSVRGLVESGYRFALAIFVSAHVFDFLFSSIWMHGYVWSLNQRVDLDLSEKSAGAIVEHQRERVGLGERVVHATLAVVQIYGLLWLAVLTCTNYFIFDISGSVGFGVATSVYGAYCTSV